MSTIRLTDDNFVKQVAEFGFFCRSRTTLLYIQRYSR